MRNNRKILQAGARINTPCGPRGESRTPLHIAAEHGHVGNVQTLVDAGADLVAKDSLGNEISSYCHLLYLLTDEMFPQD